MYDDPTIATLEAAFVRRDTDARFKRGGHEYSVNMTLPILEQLNLLTKVTRDGWLHKALRKAATAGDAEAVQPARWCGPERR